MTEPAASPVSNCSVCEYRKYLRFFTKDCPRYNELLSRGGGKTIQELTDDAAKHGCAAISLKKVPDAVLQNMPHQNLQTSPI